MKESFTLLTSTGATIYVNRLTHPSAQKGEHGPWCLVQVSSIDGEADDQFQVGAFLTVPAAALTRV